MNVGERIKKTKNQKNNSFHQDIIRNYNLGVRLWNGYLLI